MESREKAPPFVHYKHDQMEVNVIQKTQSETTSSDSYLYLKVNFLSPLEFFAFHQVPYGKT